MASKMSSAPGKRSRQRAIRRCTWSGAKYMSRPWAVIRTPREASTSSIQASSSAERASIRTRSRLREQLARARRVSPGSSTRQPVDAAVVDAPELRLEALAQRDHGAVGVRGRGSAATSSSKVRARSACHWATRGGAEALLEREVDPLEQLDGLRVVDDAVGPPRLGGAHVEGPQRRLRNALKLHARRS